MNKESNKIIKLSRNLKVHSKPDGQINSEIITQADIDILNEMQTPVDDDIEIDDGQGDAEDEDIQVETQEDQSINEIRIVVTTSAGDEKEIIIKYSE